jgi:hypothetical protein
MDGGPDDEGHEDLDSEPEDSEEPRDEIYRVKTEVTERSLPDPEDTPVSHDASPIPPKPLMNGSIKQSISSIIDRTPDSEPREALAPLIPSEPSSQGLTPVSMEQSIPAKRKYEYSPEKENTEPKEGSATE